MEEPPASYAAAVARAAGSSREIENPVERYVKASIETIERGRCAPDAPHATNSSRAEFRPQTTSASSSLSAAGHASASFSATNHIHGAEISVNALPASASFGAVVEEALRHARKLEGTETVTEAALDLITGLLCGQINIEQPQIDPTALSSASSFEILRKAAGDAGRSGVCGVVWKREELAYKCKTCERDPTCAICVACFRAGDHRGHDYSMVRTGGGCCDCGDVQAWKPSGFCSRHGGACSEKDDPAKSMPRILRQKLVQCADIVGEYIRDGCSSLAQGVWKQKPKTFLEPRISFVRKLIGWISLLINCGDGVRRIVAVRLARGGGRSWITSMLRLDGGERLPKELQSALHALYYQLITDLVFKRAFFEMFVANYERFIHSLSRKPSNQDTDTDGETESSGAVPDILDSFSVQLFTVPALIPVMLQRGGLLDVLIRVLLGIFEAAGRPIEEYRSIRFAANSGIDSAMQDEADLPPEAAEHFRPGTDPAVQAQDDGDDEDHEDNRRRRAENPQQLGRGSGPSTAANAPSENNEDSHPADWDVLDDVSIEEVMRLQPIRGIAFEAAFPEVVDRLISQARHSPSIAGEREGPLPPLNAGAGSKVLDAHESVRSPDASSTATEPVSSTTDISAYLLQFEVNEYCERLRPAQRRAERTKNGLCVETPGSVGHDGRASGSAHLSGTSASSDDEAPPATDEAANGATPTPEDTGGVEGHIEAMEGDEENTEDAAHPLPLAVMGDVLLEEEIDVLDAVYDMGAVDEDGEDLRAEALLPDLPSDGDENDGNDDEMRSVGEEDDIEENADMESADEENHTGDAPEERRDENGEQERVEPTDARARELGSGAREAKRRALSDARNRFVALLRVRRMTEQAANGTGPIAHSLRMDLGSSDQAENGFWRVICDLRYVLTHKEVAVHLVHQRPDLFRLFVRALSVMQGMNPIARQFGMHVLIEQNTWVRTFTLEIEVISIVEFIVRAFREDPRYGQRSDSRTSSTSSSSVDISGRQSRARALQIVRKCLEEWMEREDEIEVASVPAGETFTLEDSVSMHIPLHRLLALLTHHTMRLDHVDARAALSGSHGDIPTSLVHRLLTHPLRIHAYLAQVQAGMWKRNGPPVMGQSILYRTVICVEWFVDLDIFILQLCCTLLDPSDFVRRSIVEFNLKEDLEYMQIGGPGCESNDTPSPRDGQERGGNLVPPLPTPQLFSLLEDMLLLFCRIVGERTMCGYNEADIVRRKLLHRLCVHDQLHSQLAKACSGGSGRLRVDYTSQHVDEDPLHAGSDGEGGVAIPELMKTALNAIATFNRPRDMRQGRYQLKDELWDEFDPFQPHLNARERGEAEVRHHTARKRQKIPLRFLPAQSPLSRPLWTTLKSVYGLALWFVNGNSNMATKVLRMCLQQADAQPFDGLLTVTLSLIHVAAETTTGLRTPDADSSAPLPGMSWMEHVSTNTSTPEDVVGCLSRIYKGGIENSNSCFHEYLHDTVRVLRAIHERASSPLKGRLHKELPKVLAAPEGDRHGGHGPDGAGENASAAEAAERERKERVRKMKAKQAAAMAKMREEQNSFAAKLKALESEGAPNSDAAAEGSSSGPQSLRNDRVSLPQVSGTTLPDPPSTGPEQTSKPQSSRDSNPTVTHTDSERICALCHDSSSGDFRPMGMVGLAQVTKIPCMLSERPDQGPAFGGAVQARFGACQHREKGVASDDASVVDEKTTPASSAIMEVGRSSNSVEPARSRDARSSRSALFRSTSDSLAESREQADDDVDGQHSRHPSGRSSSASVSEACGDSVNAASSAQGGRSGRSSRSGDRSRNGAEIRGRRSFDRGAREENDSSSMLAWSLVSEGVSRRSGIHVGFCGHSIHISCFRRYFEILHRRHMNRDVYEGYYVVDLNRGEFLCPICRRLANVVVPIGVGDQEASVFCSGSTGEFSEKEHHTWKREKDTELLSDAPLTRGRLWSSASGRRLPVVPTTQLPFYATGPSEEPDVHQVWQHTNGVLKELARSGGGINCATQAPACPPPAYALCVATITTLVCSEIASRSGAWQGSSNDVVRRNISSFVLQTRARLCTVQSLAPRKRFVRDIWRALNSTPETDNGLRSATLEPFSALMLLLLLCIEPPTANTTRGFIRVGLQYIFARFGSDHSILARQFVLYLRRCAVLLGCMLDKNFALVEYPKDGSSASEAELLEELSSLQATVGVPIPDEASKCLGGRGSTQASRDDAALVVGPGFSASSRTVRLRNLFLPRRFGLVGLPTVFQDLLEMLDGSKCVSCGTAPRWPALCLCCGQLVCADRSKNCSGWCKPHAEKCGSGVGVFLLLKTTCVCVYRNNRQVVWGSPFLDEHGEEDLELQRGKTLQLSQERMSSLETLWLQHGFDHNARILSGTMVHRT